MKFRFLFAAAVLFPLISCTVTSKITLKTDQEVNEEVTVTEKGRNETKTYKVSSFPYTTNVTSSNFPIDITMSSPTKVYSENKVKGKAGNLVYGVLGGEFTVVGAIFMIVGAATGMPEFVPIGAGYALVFGVPFFAANTIRKRKPAEKVYSFDVGKDKSKFSVFVKEYVENSVNEWQKKGEFEKLSDWQARVNDETRRAKAQEFYSKAEAKYISSTKLTHGVKSYSLSKYDPENETFVISTNLGDMVLPVPLAEAQYFSKEFDKFTKQPEYCVIEDELALKSCKFALLGKEYSYDNQSPLAYRNTEISYNFAPIDLKLNQASEQKAVQQNISYAKMTVGDSDIDLNIPQAGKVNANTFAVVIGNENYQRETAVEYALNDATTFAKYCQQALGMPEKNIHFVGNATLNNMRAEIKWLTDVASSYNGKANIIFYYAGHGIPDEASGSSYLLPVDGYGYDVTTGYALSNLYEDLSSSATASTTVFLDACFSGAQRNGEMMASARGVAINAKAADVPGNLVVMSAANGVETAYPYKEMKHGLFTYFLLKKIQQSEGNVKLGELSSYVEQQVRQTSIVENGKSQTPTVLAGPAVKSTWAGKAL